MYAYTNPESKALFMNKFSNGSYAYTNSQTEALYIYELIIHNFWDMYNFSKTEAIYLQILKYKLVIPWLARVEILRSKLATQFTIQNDYKAAFWEIVASHGSCNAYTG